ncbi:MAG: hypothetical protein AAB776_00250 [Patescibacteria group bacterium]
MSKTFIMATFATLILLGAGCTIPRSTTNTTETETGQAPQAGPTASGASGWLETNEPLTEGEIGFTINPPEDWGIFSIVLHKISFPGNPEIGDYWEYGGEFSEQPAVIYRATDPEHVLGRGGYAGDVLGYEKRANGYYVMFLGKTAQKVPESLVIGEVPLANGLALLLQGQEASGPSSFPGVPGQLVAYLNTPNGPLPGGVFMTSPNGPVISPDKMRELLATVTIN